MARIWIVEDDPQIGLLIELTVKKAGHEARRLVDGVELERALQKDAPELLLLDLMLRERTASPSCVSGSSGSAPRTCPSSSSRRAARSATRCAGWNWARRTT